jgi:DNA transposition AAA+ family ATPase
MTKLTDFQKEKQIPDAIKLYLDEKNTNQAQLARVANVGESYMSHILQGKTFIGPTEIKDKYYTAICKAISLELKHETWRHFNTENFKLFINQIKKVRESKERLALDGDTGAGKSYTCNEYKKKYPTNTFVVTCSPIENSKEFAINIAETVEVEIHGTAGTIIKRVVKKLLRLENPILIIDEAEHIEKKSGYINIIKGLSDLLEDKVPLVLVGMGINEILKKGYERNKQNFRQTARRFSKREKCENDISEDIDKICEDLGLTSIKIKSWLKARVKNFGDLKTIITSALEEQQKSGNPITTDLLNSLYQ